MTHTPQVAESYQASPRARWECPQHGPQETIGLAILMAASPHLNRSYCLVCWAEHTVATLDAAGVCHLTPNEPEPTGEPAAPPAPPSAA